MNRHAFFTLLLSVLPLIEPATSSAQVVPTSLSAVGTAPVHLTPDPVYDTAAGDQFPMAITPIEGGYLVVWMDALTSPPERFRIMASRVTPDGAVVEKTGVGLLEVPALFQRPAVTLVALREGGGARILWMELSTPEHQVVPKVRSLFVSSDGEPSSTSDIVTFPQDGASTEGRISVARLQGRTAIAHGRYVAILREGTLVAITDLGGWGRDVEIRSTAGCFVVAWLTFDGVVMVQRLSPDGEILGAPGGRGLASAASSFDLGTDGSQALCAVGKADMIEIYGIDPQGGGIARTGVLSGTFAAPRLLWHDSRYLLAFLTLPGPQPSHLEITEVSSDGVLSSTDSKIVERDVLADYFLSTDGYRVVLATRRGTCTRWGCETDAWVTMLPSDEPGEASNRRLVSAAARAQESPRVSGSSVGYFAVWNEGGELFGALLDADTLRSGTVLEVVEQNFEGSAALASNGREWLVVYAAHDTVSDRILLRGRTVSGDGALSSSEIEIPLASSSLRPSSAIALAASPDMYLVVWEDGPEYVAVRVRSSGQILDSVPLRIGRPRFMQGVSVAFDGSDFVVAWNDATAGWDAFELQLTRVSPSGIVRPDRNVELFPSAPPDVPVVRCAQGECLVAWNTTTGEGSVGAVRIRAGDSAIIINPFSISGSGPCGGPPLAGWNGTSWVLSVRCLTGGGLGAVLLQPNGSLTAVTAAPHLIATGDESDLACLTDEVCAAVFVTRIDDPLYGRSKRLNGVLVGMARRRGVRR